MIRSIAIIPARSGSVRLKNKNTLKINNLTLIEHSIRAAINSCKIKKIVFSSDCMHMLGIAKKYGIDLHKRPAHLASNTATSEDLVLDILSEEKYSDYDELILLQPTSPLRKTFHIDECIDLHRKQNNLSTVSVTLQKNVFEVDKESNLIFKNDRSYISLNGAIFIRNIKDFIKRPSFIDKETGIYYMDRTYSIDIDTDIDFEFAQIASKYNEQKT